MPDSPTAPTSSSPAAPLVVLKFGGTSVSSAETWEVIARVLKARLDAGERPLVVHSALAGVTDRLEALPAAAREDRHGPILQEMAERHDALARELGVDPSTLLAADREELRRLASGIALLGEVTPRIRARILAFGERMATRLGAAFLQARGLPVVWMDARELLVSVPSLRANGGGSVGIAGGSVAASSAATTAAWLSAECSSDPEPALQERLGAIPGIPLTQGYTARNPGRRHRRARTGRLRYRRRLPGGEAPEPSRLEIWTDVPGMFTADPRLVPVARLLRRLDFREAQEIATTGSKVLHPRCIPALRERGSPFHPQYGVTPGNPGPSSPGATSRQLPGEGHLPEDRGGPGLHWRPWGCGTR
jgi:bifunctional diaminopimelate decarboxylase / aspartate kinase